MKTKQQSQATTIENLKSETGWEFTVLLIKKTECTWFSIDGGIIEIEFPNVVIGGDSTCKLDKAISSDKLSTDSDCSTCSDCGVFNGWILW